LGSITTTNSMTHARLASGSTPILFPLCIRTSISIYPSRTLSARLGDVNPGYRSLRHVSTYRGAFRTRSCDSLISKTTELAGCRQARVFFVPVPGGVFILPSISFFGLILPPLPSVPLRSASILGGWFLRLRCSYDRARDGQHRGRQSLCPSEARRANAFRLGPLFVFGILI
jgi:hypothetical protein